MDRAAWDEDIALELLAKGLFGCGSSILAKKSQLCGKLLQQLPPLLVLLLGGPQVVAKGLCSYLHVLVARLGLQGVSLMCAFAIFVIVVF